MPKRWEGSRRFGGCFHEVGLLLICMLLAPTFEVYFYRTCYLLMGLLQLRYEHDSTTIRLQHATRCVRFDYDSSAIQHPTRSYVLSSNNEHVNSFPLL